jgi:tripartite-type tricarboxylate transporter receptor subunit TctC
MARLTRELSKALESPTVRARIDSTTGVLTMAGPAEFDAQIRSETEKYGRLVKELGIAQ